MTETSTKEKIQRAYTLQDIADYCQVGKSTVSRAFNDDPNINARTRKRVLAAADVLGYSADLHQSARRLALRKGNRKFVNQVVAAIFPEYYHQAPYFLRMSQGILDSLTAEHFAMLTVLTYGEENDSALPAIFTRGEVDGAIIIQIPGYYLQRLQNSSGLAGHPIISMIHSLPGCSSVQVDDLQGAYLATRHLLELGHRHFLHFYDPQGGSGIMAERLRGVHCALEEWQLDPEQCLHYCQHFSLGPLAPHEAQHTLREYLASSTGELYRTNIAGFFNDLHAHPEINAILSINDAHAIHIWQILQDKGWNVPEDYSLIGFGDDLAKLDSNGNNLLTTVHLPLEELGRQAAKLIVEQITSQTISSSEVVLPTELVVRSSTGNCRK